MRNLIGNNDEDPKKESFPGLDLHRFVPLDSKVAKDINVAIPMGVYGGIKKNDTSYLNSMKNSSLMVMELVPTQQIMKCEAPKIQNENSNILQLNGSNTGDKADYSSYSFDTIKRHCFDQRYLPNEYNNNTSFMKVSLSSKKDGEITIKQLIKQASGVITEEVAKNCRATGIGLKKAVSGEITQLMIYTYSEDNQRITYGGYDFRILLTPYKQVDNSSSQDQVSFISLEPLGTDEIFEGSVIDNHDGTYTASYICKKAVPHKLEIFESKNKLPIGESPFTIQVTPGKSYPELCWAEGEGLKYYNIDGTISTFKIYSVDRMGNRTRKGGDKYEVYGVGGIKIQQILDLKNGEYEVYYKVHNSNLDDYKEINIKLYGQYIKTPAFYPISKFPQNDRLVNKGSSEIHENNLLNKTILKFDNLSIDIKPAYTLSMVFKHFNEMKKMGNGISISIPNLVPFPEERENKTNVEIIKRLEVINESKSFENNIILNEKIRASALDDYRNKSLKSVTDQLIKHEEILNDLSKAITMHCETGKEHDKKLIKDEKRLESELDEITDCQQRMFATYSCLQQGGIDSLPVSFELEDPEKVKSRQIKDRKFYIDTYNLLEKKLEEINLRKEQFEKNRDEYTQKLHKTLIARQKSIIKTQKSYSRILDELDKVYLQLSKRQTRRQDLHKNLRSDSLKVFEGLENQKILDMHLKKNIVIKLKNEGLESEKGTHQDDGDTNTKRITGRDRRYNHYSCLIPTDPESPAFWFAEASYLRDEKEKVNQYKRHDEDYNANNSLSDNPQRIKRWDLEEDSRWISCPSSVSISFSTMKTPEIQPIKQKGIFKNDSNGEVLSNVTKQTVPSKRRDPMLPENMDEEEINVIIQRDKERKKLSGRVSNVRKSGSSEDGDISKWVKNPPDPKGIKSFYNKSLDDMNESLFGVVKEPGGEEMEKEVMTEANLSHDYIDIDLLNKDVRLLPDTLWDKDFMFNLNNGATKKEDFERIRSVWQEQLKKAREMKKSQENEKLKLMQLLPRRDLNLNNMLGVADSHDEEDLNDKERLSCEWKRIHHTFEGDPRNVPWEFLSEISKLDTLPSEDLSKEDLQKYIVESLVLDGARLSNKKGQIKQVLAREDVRELEAMKAEVERPEKPLEAPKNSALEVVKQEAQLKERTGRLKPKVSSLEKAKLLISRKNFDTRREQFEHDNF